MEDRSHHNLGVSGGVNYTHTALIFLFFLILCSLPIGSKIAGSSLEGLFPEGISTLVILFGLVLQIILFPLTFLAKFLFHCSTAWCSFSELPQIFRGTAILYFSIGAIFIFFFYRKNIALNKSMALYSVFFFVQKIILDYTSKVYVNNSVLPGNEHCPGDNPLCGTLENDLIIAQLFSLSTIVAISVFAAVIINRKIKGKSE